jgi:hypothetical protein
MVSPRRTEASLSLLRVDIRLKYFDMVFLMFCVSLLGATQHAGTRCSRDLAEKTSKGKLCGTTRRSYPPCGRSPSTTSILIDVFVAVMMEV